MQGPAWEQFHVPIGQREAGWAPRRHGMRWGYNLPAKEVLILSCPCTPPAPGLLFR